MWLLTALPPSTPLGDAGIAGKSEADRRLHQRSPPCTLRTVVSEPPQRLQGLYPPQLLAPVPVGAPLAAISAGHLDATYPEAQLTLRGRFVFGPVDGVAIKKGDESSSCALQQMQRRKHSGAPSVQPHPPPQPTLNTASFHLYLSTSGCGAHSYQVRCPSLASSTHGNM
jgi:hypothetical protein